MTRSKTSAWPVFLAFLAMGFGDAIGPFVSLAREQFHLSNFAAQLIAFTGFVMFGLLSLPMGIFQNRRGKKFVLMLGLAVMREDVGEAEADEKETGHGQGGAGQEQSEQAQQHGDQEQGEGGKAERPPMAGITTPPARPDEGGDRSVFPAGRPGGRLPHRS